MNRRTNDFSSTWHRRSIACAVFLSTLLVGLSTPVRAQDATNGSAAPIPGAVIPAPAVTAASPADTLYYSEPEVVTTPPMVVARPPLQALISVENGLDPFQLDAQECKPVTLADVVEIALQNNLNIQISGLDRENGKWKLLNAYTKFLPNPHLGFSHYNIDGHIRTPFPGLGMGSGPLHIQGPFIIAQAGITYNAFQGGKLLFGALQARNNYRASKWKYHATTNDVLLEATKRYYNLLLSEAILQIRIRAVETSQEQLRLNTDLERDGMATHLDVLQARTQLADDRQNLIDQQISRRNAAIQLAEYLNVNQGIDLQPIETVIQPVRLIAEAVTAGRLLNLAAENRPELKQFREQWLAARKGIGIAAAPLLPTVQMSATEYGIGQTLDNDKKTTVTSSALSPISLAGSTPTPVITQTSRQITGLGVIGITANWTFTGIGLTDLTNIQSARVQARQAMLQSNQEVNAVVSQVR